MGIVSIGELLNRKLVIPNYQRPYKWSRRNVAELLSDIETALNESRHYGDFKYRVGTVILYKKSDADAYEIVDGQQRLITLSLLKYALDNDSRNTLLEHQFNDVQSHEHIYDNDLLIREWLSMNKERQKECHDALNNILEAVVLEVEHIQEAFQLFDSQNTRGRQLDPHDLLKAYHLRETDGFRFEKLNLIRRWENIPPEQIRELFSLYLFPILQWARKEKSKAFTAADIDNYKGVKADCTYTYAQRVRKAMPCFQINEPFCAGADFFMMVEYYVNLLSDIKNEVANNPLFEDIRKVIDMNTKYNANSEATYSSTGFRYAVNLFYCVLMFYYDRFHSLDAMSVRKLFVWAMMVRADMENLGFDTVNNYAVGTENESYSNHIQMFFKIATARNNDEIANMRIEVKRKQDSAQAERWNVLYNELKRMSGVV